MNQRRNNGIHDIAQCIEFCISPFARTDSGAGIRMARACYRQKHGACTHGGNEILIGTVRLFAGLFRITSGKISHPPAYQPKRKGVFNDALNQTSPL